MMQVTALCWPKLTQRFSKWPLLQALNSSTVSQSTSINYCLQSGSAHWSSCRIVDDLNDFSQGSSFFWCSGFSQDKPVTLWLQREQWWKLRSLSWTQGNCYIFKGSQPAWILVERQELSDRHNDTSYCQTLGNFAEAGDAKPLLSPHFQT